MRFVYPCEIIGNEYDGEGFVVEFPDVYGATTGGWSWEEARENAEDALVAALGSYYYLNEDIPLPSAVKEGQQPIALRPVAAAKVALNTAMRKQGMTKVALADKLGVTESAVRKLCNPDHHSHMSTIERALKVVGLSLVIEVVEKPVASDAGTPVAASAGAYSEGGRESREVDESPVKRNEGAR